MKVIQLFVAFLAIQMSTFAQNASNFSVANAENICFNRFDKKIYSAENGFICLNNQTKLYFTYTPSSDINLGVNISLTYDLTGSTSSYKIYGPFNPNDDYVTLIATNSAPVLNTESSISVYPKQLSGNLLSGKQYIIELISNSCSGQISFNVNINGDGYLPCFGDEVSCENCIPKFQPVNNKYIVSAWIKEANNSTATTYTNGYVKVTSGSTVNSFYGTGQIIDGWQRIEGIVTTDNVGNLKIELKTNAGTVYFDDIRVFPTEGSMITYVYDPVTLRLVAELDERNYAKIYEYDEEGKLIRVKKETEKGVMTIQENRENTHGN